MKFLFTAGAAIMAMPSTAIAQRIELDRLVGYTITAKKPIKAFYQDGKFEKGFKGCERNRIIVFHDGSTLKCKGYHHRYNYKPDAFILTKSRDIKMVVDGEIYDMERSQ